MSSLTALLPNPHIDKPGMLASFLGKVALLVNQLAKGASNTVGTVTLTNGGTTTVLKDPNITANCKIWFTATTAHAGAITGLWADTTSIVTGESAAITLNHSSVSNTDCTFWYEIRV